MNRTASSRLTTTALTQKQLKPGGMTALCRPLWQYGAGKGHQDLVYLTISTGIGGGVISSGHLLQGFHGMGAELGHMIIDADGPLCGCGYHGHVESFSSGPSIARYVNEQIGLGQKSTLHAHPDLNARQVADAAHQGDPLAIP